MLITTEQLEFRDEIPRWLNSIPHPHYHSTLFDSHEVAICCPLDPPFQHYAITHFGTVYRYRGQSSKGICPRSIVTPRIVNGISVVTLTSGNHRRSFIVPRLLSHHFFDIPLYARDIRVEYIDGDNSNVHVANLEIYTHLGHRRIIPYEHQC